MPPPIATHTLLDRQGTHSTLVTVLAPVTLRRPSRSPSFAATLSCWLELGNRDVYVQHGDQYRVMKKLLMKRAQRCALGSTVF
jgi:hypothetical protein